MSTATAKSTNSKNADTKEAELASSKQAVMAALDNLMEAREHFRHAAEAAGLDVKQEAMAQFEKGKEKAEELSDQATRYAKEKPLTTLGIAFVSGLLLSQLLSRK